ncbi:DJ-1/PfpI family protein [Gordonia alkaliphila]|uniref:DJ-1/PfpI family protein n=1 Tax=Gordonia alkaliphila TaxID=1053547 RepID=UPI0031EE5284
MPSLEINGLALGMHGGESLGADTASTMMQWALPGATPAAVRAKNPELVARRDAEKHRDAADDLSLAEFDFMFAPGGHAPMVDFHDNPVLGELLNSLRENAIPISLICHAPVAMTSARYRLDADGVPIVNDDHAFKGARVTTVPKYGEVPMFKVGYPKIPGEKTRPLYYVDEALKDAGYDVSLTLNPSAIRVIWDEEHLLLTGNGPQSVDAQADKLFQIVAARSGAPA